MTILCLAINVLQWCTAPPFRYWTNVLGTSTEGSQKKRYSMVCYFGTIYKVWQWKQKYCIPYFTVLNLTAWWKRTITDFSLYILYIHKTYMMLILTDLIETDLNGVTLHWKKCFKVSGHKQFILAKITNNALDCGTALRLCLQTTVSEVMMAPVYVAYRLASLLLCVVSVFLSVSNCYSPLVYDRQLLLDIKDSIVTTYNSELASSVVRSQSCFPNSILDVPDYLRRWHPVISLEKASQESGKRGGVAVRLKMELRTGHVSSFFRMIQNLGGGRCAVWRSLDHPARLLRPIYLDSPSMTSHYSPLRVRHGGVNVQKLRSLNRASTPVISPPPTRIGPLT